MARADTAVLSDVAQSFLELLQPEQQSATPAAINKRLDALRKLVLLEGIPRVPSEASRIRPLVWKLFLDLHRSHLRPPPFSAETFYDLATREASIMHRKIKNDTFRTLATDKAFGARVSEERLVMCLEAFVWRQQLAATSMSDQQRQPAVDPKTPYVQGMNVLAAPLLYVLPSDLEAFACFVALIEVEAPRYVRPTLDGVHDGLRLVDSCLKLLDAPLYSHLQSFRLSAELYAFPSLLTFCAGTPPLDEVVELWDFLLAYGVGLNVLCVIAQLWMMRDELLASPSPMKLLRTFPPLKSREVIPLAVGFIGDLPEDLFSRIVSHPWTDTL